MKTLSDNLSVSSAGTLLFAGHDTLALAQKYGTPLYLMDESRIRANCRMYKNAMKKHFGGDSRPLYASKAASFKGIYELMRSENMGIDVVSCGEIFAAVKAGRFLNVDPEDALNATCEKFIARFRRVEEACAARGAELSSLPLDELTRLWNEAKHPTE